MQLDSARLATESGKKDGLGNRLRDRPTREFGRRPDFIEYLEIAGPNLRITWEFPSRKCDVVAGAEITAFQETSGGRDLIPLTQKMLMPSPTSDV